MAGAVFHCSSGGNQSLPDHLTAKDSIRTMILGEASKQILFYVLKVELFKYGVSQCHGFRVFPAPWIKLNKVQKMWHNAFLCNIHMTQKT